MDESVEVHGFASQRRRVRKKWLAIDNDGSLCLIRERRAGKTDWIVRRKDASGPVVTLEAAGASGASRLGYDPQTHDVVLGDGTETARWAGRWTLVEHTDFCLLQCSDGSFCLGASGRSGDVVLSKGGLAGLYRHLRWTVHPAHDPSFRADGDDVDTPTEGTHRAVEAGAVGRAGMGKTAKDDDDKKAKTPFFSRPWVNIMMGLAVGVAGIMATLMVFLLSRRGRELTYWVEPNRAQIVSGDRPSALMVRYKNTEITEPVTAAQVVIWNAGNSSIRAENVLSAVSIVTRPRVRILAASVRRQSREVVGFRLDDSILEQGRLPLQWTIMEQNDGALVQIVFAGPPDAAISFEGTVEGQRCLSATAIDRSRWSFGRVASVVGGVICLAWVAVVLVFRPSFVLHSYGNVDGRSDRVRMNLIPAIVWALIVGGLGLWGLYSFLTTVSPPFEL